jgi:mRNA interferase RelE/StbE
MMLDLSRAARKTLQDLQPKQRGQVADRIFALLQDASPNDAKHLAGHPGYWRVDSGEFRVCYRKADDVIFVVVVGKRNDDEVYRDFARKDLP